MAYPVGVIHGRFQILHNDHVKYLLAGKSQCDHLVIGITNPEPAAVTTTAVDMNRDLPLSNPLTYYERYLLVRAAMQERGIGMEDFSIVPLPIYAPQMYGNYVPLDAVFFLTIYDAWGRQKRSYFNTLKLKTVVLWEGTPEQKGIRAEDVRQCILTGEPWEHLVPPSVAAYLHAWNIQERLIQINSNR